MTPNLYRLQRLSIVRWTKESDPRNRHMWIHFVCLGMTTSTIDDDRDVMERILAPENFWLLWCVLPLREVTTVCAAKTIRKTRKQDLQTEEASHV